MDHDNSKYDVFSINQWTTYGPSNESTFLPVHLPPNQGQDCCPYYLPNPLETEAPHGTPWTQHQGYSSSPFLLCVFHCHASGFDNNFVQSGSLTPPTFEACTVIPLSEVLPTLQLLKKLSQCLTISWCLVYNTMLCNGINLKKIYLIVYHVGFQITPYSSIWMKTDNTIN